MISEKTIHTLELHKIRDQLARFTAFSAGEELARDLYPTTNLEEAQTWQRETAEAVDLFRNKVNIGLGGARDVRPAAIGAQRGVIIEPSGLLDTRYTLKRAATLKRALGRLKGQYPLLAELMEEAEECQSVQDAIENAIDDNGEVKDSASAKLAIIRREMKVTFDRLQAKLNRIVSNKANFPYLQEALVTMRSGRYVIPIKAEYKGKIKGIVHDSSASGATLFIEPLETVELNNQWREFQIEEEKEIRRILAALTELVGEASEAICRTVEILAYLDLTLAKALYAEQLKAVQPTLVPFRPKPNAPDHPGSTLVIRGARHPLLTGNVVPMDIEFDDATWVLVVTGPNTGGKTVALKSAGLLALMAQCGLHLPAEAARLSVFEGVFADIGDEQSIEQSLSTFSSHMTNIISILDQCNERSLVILDEMGAGTDPAEGSALARAILTHLLQRKVTTMVSTHHPELKVYSVETPGVRNASVEFDLETLSPTYRLVIGLPGRSNALLIAKRLGLRDDIIEAARAMVATDSLVADDLLDEIQRTREEIRRKHAEIGRLRDELDEQRAELQKRLDSIEDERRDIIRAARRHAEEDLKSFQQELRKMRNELRAAAMPLDTLKALQETADKLLAQAQSGIDEGEVERPPELDWIPRLGDTVFLDTLNAEGTIVELDNKEAVVQVGNLKVRAKFSDIRKRTRSEARQEKARGRHAPRPTRSDNTIIPSVASPGMELDLRGQRVDEALEKLDRYVDAAYTAGLPFGRIIHGKGTGKLRQSIRDYLQAHPLVSKVTEGLPNEGGAGVTIIHMVPLN